jgi:Protein of unknown function (DUF3761)
MRRLKGTLSVAATLAAAAALVAAPGVRAAVHPAAHSAVATASCKQGYYKNVDGRCVRRPTTAPSAPAGATAKCRDGTYSFSQHASGTCSHHGGVAVWINHP